MKITIIRVDGAVYKDGVSYANLDLSAIPTSIHALQFNTESNKGWVEYVMDDEGHTPQNMQITALPDWAVTACTKWDEAKAAEEAAILALAEAAANQPESNGTQPA